MSLRYPKLLRQLRTEAHKSQAELAEVLGTSQTMYARYERGANAPPLADPVRILRCVRRLPAGTHPPPAKSKFVIIWQTERHRILQCGAFLFVIRKNRHPLHKGAGLCCICNILCSGQDCLTLRAIRYHGNLMADLLLDEGHIVLGLLGQVLKILDPANVAVPTL